jgi:hypothetical protein
MPVRTDRPLIIGILGISLTITSAVVIWTMGRDLICPCGTVEFWHGARLSPENSQHLFDLWTTVHLVGGVVFYFVAWIIARRWLPVGGLLLLAMVMICGWEILENTDFIIDRFRGAGSWDYYGDSVVNAVGDILAGLVGILAAAWFPTYVSAAGVVLLEAIGIIAIRDSFFLNIFMFIWPLESLQEWQALVGT